MRQHLKWFMRLKPHHHHLEHHYNIHLRPRPSERVFDFSGSSHTRKTPKTMAENDAKAAKELCGRVQNVPGPCIVKSFSLSLPPLALAHALHLALHKLELFFLLETISGGLWAQKPTIASELQSPIPSRSPCMPAWFLVPAPSPSSSCNPKSLAERVRST